MKCPKCTTELPDGAKFCHQCGPIYREASSKISDSVLMHSTVGQASVGTINVGDQKVRCPSCGSMITENVRSIKCRECSAFFCARCELDFRTERNPGEKPYCVDCFAKHEELIKEKSEKTKSQNEVTCTEKDDKLKERNFSDGKRELILTSKEISEAISDPYIESVNQELTGRNPDTLKPKQIVTALMINEMKEDAEVIKALYLEKNNYVPEYAVLLRTANRLSRLHREKKEEEKIYKRASEYIGIGKIVNRSHFDRYHVHYLNPGWRQIKKDMKSKNYNAVYKSINETIEYIETNLDNLTENAREGYEEALREIKPFKTDVEGLIKRQDIPDLPFGEMANDMYKIMFLQKVKRMSKDSATELKKMASVKSKSKIRITYLPGERKKTHIGDYTISAETREILNLYSQIR
jgi:hypothetical protein